MSSFPAAAIRTDCYKSKDMSFTKINRLEGVEALMHIAANNNHESWS